MQKNIPYTVLVLVIAFLISCSRQSSDSKDNMEIQTPTINSLKTKFIEFHKCFNYQKLTDEAVKTEAERIDKSHDKQKDALSANCSMRDLEIYYKYLNCRVKACDDVMKQSDSEKEFYKQFDLSSENCENLLTLNKKCQNIMDKLFF